MIRNAILATIVLVGSSTAHADSPKEQAVRALGSAVKVCYDDNYNKKTDVHGLTSSYDIYKGHRERALSLDPHVMETKATFGWLQSSDRDDPTLKARTLPQWIAFCDPWFPDTIAVQTKKDAEERARAKQHDEENKRILAKEQAENDAAANKLKGGRKQLYEERGWPTTFAGTAKDNIYPVMAKAAWWEYSSMEARNGEYLCKEYYYFKSDKVTKRRTEGLCH